MKWIQIFKTGKHTSSDGTEREYTDADLQNAINSFKAPIPVLIGHEKPNYEVAKITQLQKRGSILMGLLSEENIDKFSTLVKQGLNRISSGFSDVNNMVLDHVALLGSTPMPAIKDLKAIKFNEYEKIINIDFSSNLGEVFMDSVTTAELLEKNNLTLIEKLKGLFSKPPENTNISETNIQELIKKELDVVTANFSNQVASLKKENDELKNSLGNSFSESRLQNFEKFLDSDELKSKVTPAIKSRSMLLFNTLDSSKEINFTENNMEVKSNALDVFKELIKNIPEQVSFNEFAIGGGINTNSLAEQSKMIEEFNKKGTV